MNRQKSDIFSLENPTTSPNADDDLISIGGSRYAKINRLRGTSSSVFPIGCMGTLKIPCEDKMSNSNDDKATIPNKGDNETNEEEEEDKPPEIKTSSGDMPMLKEPEKPKRNPLTGEGMESSDMPRSGTVRRKLERTKFVY